MAISLSEAADVRAEFNGALKALARQKAGTFSGDPDKPMGAFLAAFGHIVNAPIESSEHLELLRQGIAHLRAEDPELYPGSLEQAIDAALVAAMDNADPLEKALLALARHRLAKPRLDA